MDTGLFFQILANGLMSGGMYALVASGLTLILGVAKIFNFAQGHFYMLGAYVTFAVAVTLGLPYPIALLAALASMAILGVLFHFAIVQWTIPHGFFHTVLVTILFGTMVSQASLLTFGPTQRIMPALIPGTLNIGDVALNWNKLLVIGCAIIVMAALHFFMKTRIGTAMLAAAENSDVASLQGINAKQIFWIAMAVGCGLSGIAGGLIVPVLGASLAMGASIFTRALLVLIIGGMGSMSGALIAAFLVGIIESFAFHFVGYLNLLVIFAFVAVLLYFRPGGLMGKPLPIPGE